MVAKPNLLQRESVARVELNGTLETAYRLFLFALAPLNVTF
jgi:hypothetical protein